MDRQLAKSLMNEELIDQLVYFISKEDIKKGINQYLIDGLINKYRHQDLIAYVDSIDIKAKDDSDKKS